MIIFSGFNVLKNKLKFSFPSNVSNVGRIRTGSIAETREMNFPKEKEKAKHTMSDSLINAGKRLVDW